MDRIKLLDEKIENVYDPEMIMKIIIDVFKNTVMRPQVGNYYTFLYHAKTPRIIYDQHPLVAVTSVEPWGFRGFNFHWNEMRSYTWNELYSNLHIIENDEIIFFLEISSMPNLRVVK